MKVNKTSRVEVTIKLTLDEAVMLHRIVCTGMLGGDSRVQSSLYTKLERANEYARLGRAVLIEIDGTRKPEETKTDGKEKAQLL